jgi:hypothetical protein
MRNWSGEHALADISKGYRKGVIDLPTAVKYLERNNSDHARLNAGRLCTTEAYRHDSIETISSWLGRAACNYETLAQRKKLSGHRAHALLHLAQLPNHGCITSTNSLPARAVAQKTFNSTLEQAVGIRESAQVLVRQRQTPDTAKTGKDLGGAQSEASVLLLLQRYALKHDTTEWFPLFSSYDQDHANSRGSSIEQASDISIFTSYGEGIDETYTIQVKSSAPGAHNSQRELSDKITTIAVKTDLALYPSECVRVGTVVIECALEQTGHPQASDRLDRRTDILLDLIG